MRALARIWRALARDSRDAARVGRAAARSLYALARIWRGASRDTIACCVLCLIKCGHGFGQPCSPFDMGDYGVLNPSRQSLDLARG